MRKAVLVLVCAFVVCAVAGGFAGEAMAWDGNELLGYCQTYLKVDGNMTGLETFGDGMAFGGCAGFVSGVVTTSGLWQEGMGKQVDCSPEGAEVNQLIRVVTKYLEGHPAELHRHSVLLIQLALTEAWPCAEGGE